VGEQRQRIAAVVAHRDHVAGLRGDEIGEGQLPEPVRRLVETTLLGSPRRAGRLDAVGRRETVEEARDLCGLQRRLAQTRKELPGGRVRSLAHATSPTARPVVLYG
jgi:hypothetical protein